MKLLVTSIWVLSLWLTVGAQEDSGEIFADAEQKISFLYYDLDNMDTPITLSNDTESFSGTSFDPSRKTMVLIHGFLESQNFSNLVDFRNIYLENYDDNVIGVNFINYTPSDGDIYLFYMNIGNIVCDYIQFLIEELQVDPDNIHIIAHSVGCHVAGQAGKCLRLNGNPVKRLTGLDPANWSDMGNTPMDILRPADAQTVDCIHTSLSFGIHTPICQCNYYPANGHDQPGCNDVIGLCDHLSSFRYYQNSIRQPKGYPGLRCSGFSGKDLIGCDPGNMGYLGVDADKYCESGSIYYVPILIPDKAEAEQS